MCLPAGRVRQSWAGSGVRAAFKTWAQVGGIAHVLNGSMPQTSSASVKVKNFISKFLLGQ